jgi:hypothetical protein
MLDLVADVEQLNLQVAGIVLKSVRHCGSLADLHKFLDGRSALPDVTYFTAVITSFVKLGDLDGGIRQLTAMSDAGVAPN